MTTDREPTTTDLEVAAAKDAAGAPTDPWARYWRMSKIVAETEMVPPALRGRPDAVFALALYAEAVGIHPAIAWQQVAFVAGKPVPSAELQRSLILAAGHRLDIVEMGNEKAIVRGTRTDGADLTVTFTLDDATRAGLLKKGGAWSTYPSAMLLARATSALARALFPDAIGGLSYLREELDEAVAPSVDAGLVIDHDDEIELAEVVDHVDDTSTHDDADPEDDGLERPF